MTTIHIFNPESDYALASFSPAYTPPPAVVDVRRRLAFIPLKYAAPGDILLLQDDISRNEMPESEGIRIVNPDRAPDFMKTVKSDPEDYVFLPWGWNPAIKRTLAKWGAPTALLPDDNALSEIRALSHRRTSIQFNDILNRILADAGIGVNHISPLPAEFFNANDVMTWLSENPKAFLKAPWSSSGRGILFCNEHTKSLAAQRWIQGTLRRQGSLLAETAADKRLDFATEWHIHAGIARFLGLSVFETSANGKYISNTLSPEEEKFNHIRRFAPDFSPIFIESQRKALESLAGGYEGFAGIDMLATSDGSIRGCVEINFRLTMGMASLPGIRNTISSINSSFRKNQ